MKIIFKENFKKVLFSNVLAGECFEVSGVIYMKLPSDEYTSGIKNVMNMENGEFLYFGNEKEVIPVETELHVRYKKE